MKLYVFMATSICSIGGGSLYYKNKIKYLENKGWNILIFSFVKGKPSLSRLMSYEDCIMEELKFPPYLYTKRKRMKILTQVLKKINSEQYHQIIIESNHTAASMWGEYIASQTGAKHFIYALNEKDNKLGEEYLKFLKFKLERKELAGIVKQTVENLLSSYMVISEQQHYVLGACPGGAISNVEDVEFLEPRIQEGKINVLSLGRLEKSYILPILQEFCDYANKNKELKFNLLILGSNSQIEKSIASMFTNVKNVNLIFLGSLFPIPLKLLKLVDVNIASSGSAGLTYKFGIPTISVDGNDYRPIGILGYNAKNRLFRSNEEPVQELGTLLDLIIKDKTVKKDFHIAEQMNLNMDYSTHLQFVNDSNSSKEYYDIKKFDSRLNNLIAFVGQIIGLEKCNVLYKKLKRA